MAKSTKKETKKKPAKKRASKYENKLQINGSFLDVINAAVKPKK